MQALKNFIIRRINQFLFNYEEPKYRTFLFHLAQRYVNFYKGEHNADMMTNGEYRVLTILIKNYKAGEIFDIGANVGDYSHLVLELNKNLNVHCFEPVPRTFQQLKSSMTGTRTILNNLALSDEQGMRDMYINDQANTLNSFHVEAVSGEKIPVAVSSLDIYCTQKEVRQIYLMKIDVEGHELSVLKGGKNILSSQQVDYIQFEFGNAAIYSRTFFKDILDLLTQYGYEVYKIKPKVLEKVVYGPEFEKIMYANFLAVGKNKGIFEFS